MINQASWMERYSRQILLPQIGGVGQKKLGESSVGLIGTNSICQPFFLYGVGAGIGKWGVIDTIKSRATELASQANLRNPTVEVVVFPPNRLKRDVESWVKLFSIVIDASNDTSIQQQLASACQLTRTPIISAGYQGSTGWLLQAPCPFCLGTTPPPPSAKNIDTPLDAMVPGVIGTLLAQHVINFLLEPPKKLPPLLLSFTADRSTFLSQRPYIDPNCPSCHNPKKIN
ncbi:MAG: ThiF family adenylyltransferase [Magnetococcales bacterium]|nr:ThiF family adenylyltransferase [Magnetococcales bacterium]